MVVTVAILLTVVFALLLWATRLITIAKRVLATSRESLRVMRDPALDELEKEKRTQRAAVAMFGLLGLIVLAIVATFGVPALVLIGLDAAGVVVMGDVLRLMMGWPFLVSTLVAAAVIGWVLSRGSTSNYSGVDRALHRMAFGGIGIQKSLADIEDRVHGKRLAQVTIERPIFVTSLPRAGTTLLLETLATLPGVVSHSYRHMPFVLTPILWRQLSGPFRKEAELRERAHGDGMTVGYDSVEAFEEVAWRAHWPGKYHPNRIETWSADDADPEGAFDDFFRNHIRKLLLVEAGQRYVSKNNANVARIPKLLALFPDAVVLVPVRRPIAHAASLLKTQRKLLALQQADPFARRYMRDIGHFDFGMDLRPIDFDGWLGAGGRMDGEDVNQWLRYWCAAYTYLLRDVIASHVAFVDYDALCSDPKPRLAAVAERLQLAQPDDLIAKHATFRAPTAYADDELGADPALLAQAEAIYERLCGRAVC